MKQRYLFVCYLIAVVFVLTEWILRIGYPLPEQIGDEVNRKYTQHFPGVKNEIIFQTNMFGLRSLSMRTKSKPPNTLRIIAVGGSSSQQSLQSMEDTTFGILQLMLNDALRDTGYQVEIAVWGKGGGSVWDAYAYCVGRMRALNPDMVLLMWGVNDATWNGAPTSVYPGKEKRIYQIKSQLESTSEKIKAFLRKHSQIYLRISYWKWQKLIRKNLQSGKALEWHSEKMPELIKSYKNLPYRTEIVRDPDPIVEFRDGMEAILEDLSRQGIRGIVLGQPVLWKPEMSLNEQKVLWFPVATPEGYVRADTKWLFEEMHRFNQAQQKLAAQYKMPYIDLDAKIQKTLEYYIDDCHYTDKGARQVALEVFPTLLEEVRKMISSLPAAA